MRSRKHFQFRRSLSCFLLFLCLAPLSVRADITWTEAQTMLRAGAGLSPSPALGAPAPDPGNYGAEANPTGDPIGGGAGYSDIYTTGDYVVDTKAGLLNALNSASPGEVVYVEPGAAIDLTGERRINVPAGVTLAGNRGHNGSDGPLLFTNDLVEVGASLLSTGEDCRITGLRIRGPDPDMDDYTEATKNSASAAAARGMSIRTDCEIDNCELSNFYRDGFNLGNDRQIHIHHNHIHDIAAYPIIITYNGCNPLIEANRIGWGWHAIAGTGAIGTGYEARYNLFEMEEMAVPPWERVHHCLDMHADRDIRNPFQMVGADLMLWHHNTIELSGPYAHPDYTYGMKLRGTPRLICQSHNNWFKTENISQALGPFGDGTQQQALGNFWTHDNAYGDDKRLLVEADYRTAPQIVLRTDCTLLPVEEVHEVNGTMPLDIEVNTLDRFTLCGVIVMLGDTEIFLDQRAPEPGEISVGEHLLDADPTKLRISAIDTRGALGTQFIYVKNASQQADVVQAASSWAPDADVPSDGLGWATANMVLEFETDRIYHLALQLCSQSGAAGPWVLEYQADYGGASPGPWTAVDDTTAWRPEPGHALQMANDDAVPIAVFALPPPGGGMTAEDGLFSNDGSAPLSPPASKYFELWYAIRATEDAVGHTWRFRVRPSGGDVAYPVYARAKEVEAAGGDLVGHWMLDETSGTMAADSSEYGNNGALKGGLDFAADSAPGPLGGALAFDQDDHIDCGTGESLMFNGSETGITLAFWVSMSEWPGTGSYATLLGRHHRDYLVSTASTAEKRFLFWKSDGAGGYETMIATCDGFVFGGWNHLAITFDKSTETGTIYCNGALEKSETEWESPSLYTSDSRPFTIGLELTGNYRFAGRMDDVRVYRRALTGPEIAGLAAAGALGSLQVQMEPAEAAAAGGQWCLDDGAWQESGATLERLAPGDHLLTCMDVPGWIPPAPETVQIQTGVLVHTATCRPNGDFDRNGVVDFWDFMRFVEVYGLSVADPGWGEDCVIGDFDDNGQVDFWDFMAFVEVYEG